MDEILLNLYSSALQAARDFSTAKYSHIEVGAAALLDSGEVVVGANHENCSFPVGICAERSMLCSVQNQNPNSTVKAIAIAALRDDKQIDISPCGMCRQAILEQELAQGSPIKIIFHYNNSSIILDSATALLPYSFTL